MSTDHGAAGFCTDPGQPAQAVVAADTEGIARVMEKHRLNFDIDGGEECQDDDWDGSGAYETHLAGVVAAYLAGEPRE